MCFTAVLSLLSGAARRRLCCTAVAAAALCNHEPDEASCCLAGEVSAAVTDLHVAHISSVIQLQLLLPVL
jgi:hypothetical protein